MLALHNIVMHVTSDDGATLFVIFTASLAGALIGSLITGAFAWFVFRRGVLEPRRERARDLTERVGAASR